MTAPGGGDVPGRWNLAFTAGSVILDAPDSTKVTGNPWTPSGFGVAALCPGSGTKQHIDLAGR